MSRLAPLRRRGTEALLAVYFALAPSTVRAWRLDPARRVATVLLVGEPTPFLIPRPPELALDSPADG